MTESLSKGQVDRLGNVIRDGHMGDDEWLQFEFLRRRWAKVELALKDEIREVFPGPDVDISSRLKNFETIREKLRRSSMRLSQMRDIVGYRIVTPGGRLRQDEISARLCTHFQNRNIKTFDRRSNPNYGYRALRLEVEFDGLVVEIQIRTLLQHGWAEAMERLADIAGRGIRYGKPLEYDHMDPLLQKLLVSLSEQLVDLSDVIDKYERLEDHDEILPLLKVLFPERNLSDLERHSQERDLPQLRSGVLNRIGYLQAMLTEIRETLG